ncbi:MAG: hypothetical protein QXU20_04105 [Candidatus Woesearchaeota archaeon]
MDLLNKIVSFGIAIFLTILVFLFMELVYPAPDLYYYDYNDCYMKYNCDIRLMECETKFEQNSTEYNLKINECRNKVLESVEYKKCMEEQYSCTKESFKKSPLYSHSKISFFILMFIGVILILSSIFLIKVEALKSGFMLSSILIIIISTLRSWNYLMYNKLVSLFLILLVLMILIFYSYKDSLIRKSIKVKMKKKK